MYIYIKSWIYEPIGFTFPQYVSICGCSLGSPYTSDVLAINTRAPTRFASPEISSTDCIIFEYLHLQIQLRTANSPSIFIVPKVLVLIVFTGFSM